MFLFCITLFICNSKRVLYNTICLYCNWKLDTLYPISHNIKRHLNLFKILKILNTFLFEFRTEQFLDFIVWRAPAETWKCYECYDSMNIPLKSTCPEADAFWWTPSGTFIDAFIDAMTKSQFPLFKFVNTPNLFVNFSFFFCLSTCLYMLHCLNFVYLSLYW